MQKQLLVFAEKWLAIPWAVRNAAALLPGVGNVIHATNNLAGFLKGSGGDIFAAEPCTRFKALTRARAESAGFVKAKDLRWLADQAARWPMVAELGTILVWGADAVEWFEGYATAELSRSHRECIEATQAASSQAEGLNPGISVFPSFAGTTFIPNVEEATSAQSAPSPLPALAALAWLFLR